MAARKNASEFEKIIHADRERKQKEALAARIFNRDRRSSAPSKASAQTPAASLASRAGVKKHRASSGPVNQGDLWVHDLHGFPGAAAPGSLASRVTTPGSKGAGGQGSKRQQQPQQQRRNAKLAFAITRDQAQAPAQRQASIVAPQNRAGGISIRGLAGPPVVMAQNFAPGTTAADIESAFTPYGGIMSRCRLLKTSPIIIAEVVFEDPSGAQRVIDRFNNQVADGRVLKVYHKSGPAPIAPAPLPSSNGNIIDGSHGFAEGDKLAEGDDVMGGVSSSGSRLYSDSLLSGGKSSNYNDVSLSRRAGRAPGSSRGRNGTGR